MTRARRRSLTASVAVAIVVVVALGVWAATTGGGGSRSAAAAEVNPNRSVTALGGQFLASCPFSHTLPDDPIVHTGMPGMSHQHEFFGNTGTNAFSTYATLRAGQSTCSDVGDHSAYWVPTLFVDGTRVVPRRADAYYRVGEGIDFADVKPFPNGLQALAGNQFSQVPQSLDIVAWTCGLSPKLHHRPPSNCTPDRPVNLRLTFPDCWNGHQLTSPDHTSHLAYSGPDGCPRSHPVPIPQLTLVVHYPVSGPFHSARLASGSFNTSHGDFFEAWKPSRIRAQVTGCLNRNVTCGIVGGTFHTGPGSRDRNDYNHPQHPDEPYAAGTTAPTTKPPATKASATTAPASPPGG